MNTFGFALKLGLLLLVCTNCSRAVSEWQEYKDPAVNAGKLYRSGYAKAWVTTLDNVRTTPGSINERLAAFKEFHGGSLIHDGNNVIVVCLNHLKDRALSVAYIPNVGRPLWIVARGKSGKSLKGKLESLIRMLDTKVYSKDVIDLNHPLSTKRFRLTCAKNEEIELPKGWFDFEESLGAPPNLKVGSFVRPFTEGFVDIYCGSSNLLKDQNLGTTLTRIQYGKKELIIKTKLKCLIIICHSDSKEFIVKYKEMVKFLVDEAKNGYY